MPQGSAVTVHIPILIHHDVVSAPIASDDYVEHVVEQLLIGSTTCSSKT